MDGEQLKAIKDKQNASKSGQHENDVNQSNNKRGKKATEKANKSATKS